MDNRVRVLQVIAGMGSGGAEMFLMNMYRNMDHDKIVFDFLLQSSENIYKEELESYGSKIWEIPPYYKKPFQNHSALKKVLAKGYPIVHVHANALLYITPILYAEKAGISCRIMHSHNTSMYYKWALPYHNLNKIRIKKHATHCFACSEEAGTWMFGSDYTVISNAIDLERFAFRPDLRDKYRSELGISEGDLAIGQIGRLFSTKNQSFSLDVFHEVLMQRKNCRLLFIGIGGDEAMLREKATKLGIADRVSFLGVRTDVSSLVNAFDLLLLPSLYEGFPVVMVEAQANGLPILCSSAVTERSVLSSNVWRLPLEIGKEKWAESILSADPQRLDNRKILSEAGFDIRRQAKQLQAFYLEQAGVSQQ